MTMRERIKEGRLFTDYCEGLPEDRLHCKKVMTAFNRSEPDDMETRLQLMRALFGRDTKAWIEPPFYCCYGTNISLGDGTYINMNCSFIDDGKISIGRHVMFGPAVVIATVGHPVKPDMRAYMYTDPVTIEDNCWIGANVTICPGVTIGENTVVGAGSVVTKSLPANVVAAGNPCRVIREIDERDSLYYYRDRLFSDSGIPQDGDAPTDEGSPKDTVTAP